MRHLENSCRALVLGPVDRLNMCCTSILLSGEYGGGLKTGILGDCRGVVSSHRSGGVRTGYPSAATKGGEYTTGDVVVHL